VTIEGCILLRNDAQIRDNAKLSGGVQVAHHAVVAGNSELVGDVLVLDRALVTDNVKIIGTEKQIVVRNVDVLRGRQIITTNEQVRACDHDRPRKRSRSKTELDIRDDRVLGT
jgi:carbonic anhydrase/acetyltransferase-like protein (isoleucine patch superfamily)